MVKAPLYISVTLLLFYLDLANQKVLLVKTDQKVFLVKTVEKRPAAATKGEDYQDVPEPVPNRSLDHKGKCGPDCRGRCRKDEAQTPLWFLGSNPVTYKCESQLVPQAQATPPAPPTTQKPASCVRSPKNAKRTSRYQRKWVKKQCTGQNGEEEEESWGFWVEKGRGFGENSFCCNRGPRTGEMVRTPRKCARTPK